jgi:hypothetical protein
VEKTFCPRLLRGRRVPQTRTPLKFSRQSAVARSKKVTHNHNSQFIILNPAVRLAADTWSLLFPHLPPTTYHLSSRH